ncbi:uncharacterized protein HMPREF1541_03512 [Cyphellophora europaea CBS 101466]|uniref:Uncharacterized protein n=1 Tax=Cyphellophora europaea (strain CBS 101466) TaxID=1220924 RepID=W2RYJ5_CYPE1|nr:uncharacterized protein HMPREF1541_03512 [Cyphellophora europaea CBS 101466]ETN41576.1 hypothetical protein HMPREF1541_03512 [Cyphellophora europaea CBS 101466]
MVKAYQSSLHLLKPKRSLQSFALKSQTSHMSQLQCQHFMKCLQSAIEGSKHVAM